VNLKRMCKLLHPTTTPHNHSSSHVMLSVRKTAMALVKSCTYARRWSWNTSEEAMLFNSHLYMHSTNISYFPTSVYSHQKELSCLYYWLPHSTGREIFHYHHEYTSLLHLCQIRYFPFPLTKSVDLQNCNV